MNDGTEYAKMLEIPLSSCEYVYHRRRKILNKKKIIKKVNDDLTKDQCELQSLQDEGLCDDSLAADCVADCPSLCDKAAARGDVKSLKLFSKAKEKAAGKRLAKEGAKKAKSNIKKREKAKADGKKFKFDIIHAEIAAAFVLIVAIILTNIFWDNSGMNTLFKSVFSTESNAEDNRSYDQFSLGLPVHSQGVALAEGVITVSGEHALYPVCGGEVEKVDKNAQGKYTLTIKHSNTFKSIIDGADFVYYNVGESVSVNLPVCYAKSGAEVYLYSNNSMLTDFCFLDDSIVWNE